MNISVGLYSEDNAPVVAVVSGGDRGHFISVRLTGEVSVFAPGYNAAASAWARDLAVKLVIAAEEMDRTSVPVEAEAVQ